MAHFQAHFLSFCFSLCLSLSFYYFPFVYLSLSLEDNFVRNSFRLMGRRFMSQTDASNGPETDRADDAAHSNCRLTNFYKCVYVCVCPSAIWMRMCVCEQKQLKCGKRRSKWSKCTKCVCQKHCGNTALQVSVCECVRASVCVRVCLCECVCVGVWE